MTEEEKELLRRALVRLEQRGWTQKMSVDKDGRLCLWEAIRQEWIRKNPPPGPDEFTGTETLWEALGFQLLDDGHSDAEEWQDAEGRTFEEVRELIKRTIEAAGAR